MTNIQISGETEKTAPVGSDMVAIDDASLATYYARLASINLTQDGAMVNGKISVTVASNNITLALKDLAGNNPSATSPVTVRIGGTLRSITAALSVTKNAGTNWCNAGGTELATKEIDYFAYLGYNATDGVVIGFSRIPFATLYSDFNTTSTNEKYCAISTITNAAAGDNYVVIGRFAATLSAGAGYTWSVPVYTTANLVQRPVYETRFLDWAPAYTGSGSLTFTTVTTNVARYKIVGNYCSIAMRAGGTTGGTTHVSILVSLPFNALQIANPPAGWGRLFDASALGATPILTTGTPNTISGTKYDNSNWGLGTGRIVTLGAQYEI